MTSETSIVQRGNAVTLVGGNRPGQLKTLNPNVRNDIFADAAAFERVAR